LGIIVVYPPTNSKREKRKEGENLKNQAETQIGNGNRKKNIRKHREGKKRKKRKHEMVMS
jgi:hypothetical protein